MRQLTKVTFDLSLAGLSPGDPGPSPHLSGQQRRLHPLLRLQNSQQLPQEVPVAALHRYTALRGHMINWDCC